MQSPGNAAWTRDGSCDPEALTLANPLLSNGIGVAEGVVETLLVACGLKKDNRVFCFPHDGEKLTALLAPFREFPFTTVLL